MTTADRIVGRDRELVLVSKLVDGVGERGGALVVCGEPGIGKSALLAATAERAAAQGMQVLRASGVQSEAHLPFAGLHQLLRPILGGAADLPAPQRAALLAAFGMSDEAAPDRFLIALAVLDLVAEAAASPHLLIVEDAHWLDASSADVLTFVARRLSSDPIVLLAGVRSGFATPFEDAGLPELRLERLDDTAAANLLDARWPGLAPAVRERLLADASGNPLALVELPVASAELGEGALLPPWLPLTDRLEQAFVARVAGLPEATRTLLTVAACDDGGVAAEVLAAAAIVSGGERVLAELTPAVAAQLVDVDALALRFRHPLVRSAIHQAASVPERLAAHAALVQVLTDQPHRRAWHRAASVVGPDEDVAAELELAAGSAQQRGSGMAAIAALERAAALSPERARKAERLLHAAELAFELGQRELVARLLDEVERLALEPLDRARVKWIRESFDDGVTAGPLAARALADVAAQTAADDTSLAVNLLGGAAVRCWWGGPGEDVRARIVEVADGLALDGYDARLIAILAWADPVRLGPEVIERLSALPPDPHGDGRAMRLYGMAATAVGHQALAAGFLDAAVACLRADGRLALLAQVLILRAWSGFHLGSRPTSVADLEEGARLAVETSQPLWEARARAGQAAFTALRGDTDAAEALAADVERVALPAHASAALADIQHVRGIAALGAGRHGDAYEQLRRVFDPSDPAHHYMKSLWALGDLAEAAVQSGHRDEARVLLRELEPAAERTPAPRIHVAMRHARALLVRPEEAERQFALALAADLGNWPFARARLQLALGSWLRRQRRVADSRAPLRAARDAFDALGVLPWGERARQELRASGESSRQRRPDARDDLTPQELQIAQMAGDGLSNREIGQQLYLSHRTVGSHLYRVYPKLGITSRAELRDVLYATT